MSGGLGVRHVSCLNRAVALEQEEAFRNIAQDLPGQPLRRDDAGISGPRRVEGEEKPRAQLPAGFLDQEV